MVLCGAGATSRDGPPQTSDTSSWHSLPFPPFSRQPPYHLQKVPRVAAIAEAGVVGGVSEVFQSETGGFELKQLGERFGSHTAACAPAGGAGAPEGGTRGRRHKKCV